MTLSKNGCAVLPVAFPTEAENKRELCKEFSWMANESYVETYNKLKENPNLPDEAQYALDRLIR